MNIDQIVKIGAEAFQSSIGQQAGSALPLENIMAALARLMPGAGESIDFAGLIDQMKRGGLAQLAQSWLGDGKNAGIDVGDLTSMFDSEKISAFATQLGLDRDTAMEGLRGAVPEMVDKASSGGTLDALGGISGLAGMAGKLFGK
ncbi:MAG: YidB family protein [Wenzhouxiangella sp.]|jgi:uncharacterized protein YidB (DUF937 family)|nr:YidB family protein [Wenzhouxiangella sp.]